MMTVVLLRQIAVMALLMAAGVWLVKKKMLSEQGCKELGALLLNVVIPCVILRSYMIDFSVEKLKELALSAALAVFSLVIAMVVGSLVYGTKRGIQNFAASFCNAGFIGIPLTQAVFGSEAVFYVAASVAFLNLFQWTYGLYIMTGDKSVIRIGRILKNPVFLSIGAGILLFLCPVPIPEVFRKTVGYLADMNTPLAMLILGSYLVKTDFKGIVLEKKIYGCVLMRLVIIPLLTMAIFRMLPVKNPQIVMVVLIAASTAVGGNIAIFAQQYDADYLLAVKTVCLSTIASVVTTPLLVGCMQMMWHI